MASVAFGQEEARASETLLALVADKGSAGHRFATSESLLGAQDSRTLADLIHYLCALHGRHPGMVELAAERVLDGPARAWLAEMAPAFAAERGLLARLSVAAGPVPSTPGTGTEGPVATQRSALQTLGRSERRGCALGAAFAFAADWTVIRALLGQAAERLGVAVPPAPLRTPGLLSDVIDSTADAPSVRRAMLFGAEQLALQHRAMWDLLDARASARIG